MTSTLTEDFCKELIMPEDNGIMSWIADRILYNGKHWKFLSHGSQAKYSCCVMSLFFLTKVVIKIWRDTKGNLKEK